MTTTQPLCENCSERIAMIRTTLQQAPTYAHLPTGGSTRMEVACKHYGGSDRPPSVATPARTSNCKHCGCSIWRINRTPKETDCGVAEWYHRHNRNAMCSTSGHSFAGCKATPMAPPLFERPVHGGYPGETTIRPMDWLRRNVHRTTRPTYPGFYSDTPEHMAATTKASEIPCERCGQKIYRPIMEHDWLHTSSDSKWCGPESDDLRTAMPSAATYASAPSDWFAGEVAAPNTMSEEEIRRQGEVTLEQGTADYIALSSEKEREADIVFGLTNRNTIPRITSRLTHVMYDGRDITGMLIDGGKLTEIQGYKVEDIEPVHLRYRQPTPLPIKLWGRLAKPSPFGPLILGDHADGEEVAYDVFADVDFSNMVLLGWGDSTGWHPCGPTCGTTPIDDRPAHKGYPDPVTDSILTRFMDLPTKGSYALGQEVADSIAKPFSTALAKIVREMADEDIMRSMRPMFAPPRSIEVGSTWQHENNLRCTVMGVDYETGTLDIKLHGDWPGGMVWAGPQFPEGWTEIFTCGNCSDSVMEATSGPWPWLHIFRDGTTALRCSPSHLALGDDGPHNTARPRR